MEMSTANNSSLIVDQLVTYADWFFPGEIDFDRDLDVGIVNGSENQVVGMRRCMSNSSLSDLGESPPQGSPKPATRRKNKPAPIPPAFTPDKHERKSDDKPPPAPDKPPRPLATATLNRVTYKAQKHEVNAELINPSNRSGEKIEKNSERNAKSINCDVSTKSIVANQMENIERPVETRKEQQETTIAAKANYPTEKVAEELKSVLPIGFEALVKTEHDANDESENLDSNSSKVKQVPSEKTCPATQERRPIPVAAPRSITNISLQTPGKLEKENFIIQKLKKKLKKNI